MSPGVQFYMSPDTGTPPKASELSDYSVCTTWGIKDGRWYLLDVLRRRMEYPELKRAVRAHADRYRASVVLIEDRASGTQLIQELVREGLHAVKGCTPTGDKQMRAIAQTPWFENGCVYLPKEAPWLADYVNELTSFPGGRHDDQVDSTVQAFSWLNTRPRVSGEGLLQYYRERAERLQGKGQEIWWLRVPPDASTHIYTADGRCIAINGRKKIDLPKEDAIPVLALRGWSRIIEDDDPC